MEILTAKLNEGCNRIKRFKKIALKKASKTNPDTEKGLSLNEKILICQSLDFIGKCFPKYFPDCLRISNKFKNELDPEDEVEPLDLNQCVVFKKFSDRLAKIKHKFDVLFEKSSKKQSNTLNLVKELSQKLKKKPQIIEKTQGAESDFAKMKITVRDFEEISEFHKRIIKFHEEKQKIFMAQVFPSQSNEEITSEDNGLCANINRLVCSMEIKTGNPFYQKEYQKLASQTIKETQHISLSIDRLRDYRARFSQLQNQHNILAKNCQTLRESTIKSQSGKKVEIGIIIPMAQKFKDFVIKLRSFSNFVNDVQSMDLKKDNKIKIKPRNSIQNASIIHECITEIKEITIVDKFNDMALLIKRIKMAHDKNNSHYKKIKQENGILKIDIINLNEDLKSTKKQHENYTIGNNIKIKELTKKTDALEKDNKSLVTENAALLNSIKSAEKSKISSAEETIKLLNVEILNHKSEFQTLLSKNTLNELNFSEQILKEKSLKKEMQSKLESILQDKIRVENDLKIKSAKSDELISQLVNFQSVIKSQKAKIDILESECNDKTKSTKETFESLHAQIKSLKVDIEQNEFLRTQKLSEIQLLQNNLSQMTQQNDSHRAELNSLRKTCENLTSENKSQNSLLETKLEEIANLQKALTNLKDENGTMRNDIDSLIIQKSRIITELNNVNQKSHELQTQIEFLDDQNKILNQKHETECNQNIKLCSELHSIQEKHSKIILESEQIKAEYVFLVKKNDLLLNEKNVSKLTSEKTTAEFTKLQNEVEILSEKNTELKQLSEKNIDELTGKYQSATSEVQSLNSANSKLLKQVEIQTRESEEIKIEFEKLRLENHQLKIDSDDLKKDSECLQRNIDCMERDNDKLRAEIQFNTLEINKITEKFKTAETEKEHLAKEIAKINENDATKQQTFVILESEIEDLKIGQQILINEKSNITKLLESNNFDINTLASMNDSLSAENERLEKEISAAKQNVEFWRNESELLKKRVKKLVKNGEKQSSLATQESQLKTIEDEVNKQMQSSIVIKNTDSNLINQINEQISEKNRLIESLNDQLKVSDDHYKALEAKAKILEGKLVQTQSTSEMFAKEIKKMQSESSEMKKQFNLEISALKKELDEKIKIIVETEINFKNLNRELKARDQALKDAQHQLIKLKKENEKIYNELKLAVQTSTEPPKNPSVTKKPSTESPPERTESVEDSPLNRYKDIVCKFYLQLVGPDNVKVRELDFYESQLGGVLRSIADMQKSKSNFSKIENESNEFKHLVKQLQDDLNKITKTLEECFQIILDSKTRIEQSHSENNSQQINSKITLSPEGFKKIVAQLINAYNQKSEISESTTREAAAECRNLKLLIDQIGYSPLTKALKLNSEVLKNTNLSMEAIREMGVNFNCIIKKGVENEMILPGKSISKQPTKASGPIIMTQSKTSQNPHIASGIRIEQGPLKRKHSQLEMMPQKLLFKNQLALNLPKLENSTSLQAMAYHYRALKTWKTIRELNEVSFALYNENLLKMTEDMERENEILKAEIIHLTQKIVDLQNNNDDSFESKSHSNILGKLTNENGSIKSQSLAELIGYLQDKLQIEFPFDSDPDMFTEIIKKCIDDMCEVISLDLDPLTKPKVSKLNLKNVNNDSVNAENDVNLSISSNVSEILKKEGKENQNAQNKTKPLGGNEAAKMLKTHQIAHEMCDFPTLQKAYHDERQISENLKKIVETLKKEIETLSRRISEGENAQLTIEHIKSVFLQFLIQHLKGGKDAKFLIEILCTHMDLSKADRANVLAYVEALEPNKKIVAKLFTTKK